MLHVHYLEHVISHRMRFELIQFLAIPAYSFQGKEFYINEEGAMLLFMLILHYYTTPMILFTHSEYMYVRK